MLNAGGLGLGGLEQTQYQRPEIIRLEVGKGFFRAGGVGRGELLVRVATGGEAEMTSMFCCQFPSLQTCELSFSG